MVVFASMPTIVLERSWPPRAVHESSVAAVEAVAERVTVFGFFLLPLVVGSQRV
jgi:hypothetical protein